MDRRTLLLSTSSTAALSISGAFAQSPQSPASPEQDQRTTSEELVTAHTEDKLTQAGLIFSPSPERARPTAVVWVHGATANFYYPSYVAIARKMASQGYRFLLANTRMHDIGCVLAEYADGSVLRGGFLWGLPSEAPLDIAAWIDVAEKKGHASVVLIGHSAGGAAVRRYVAERTDKRVVGWSQASVGLALWPPRGDAESERCHRQPHTCLLRAARPFRKASPAFAEPCRRSDHPVSRLDGLPAIVVRVQMWSAPCGRACANSRRRSCSPRTAAFHGHRDALSRQAVRSPPPSPSSQLHQPPPESSPKRRRESGSLRKRACHVPVQLRVREGGVYPRA